MPWIKGLIGQGEAPAGFISDWLVVRITVNPGQAFLDRMIAMVESTKRQKTPNEIALAILLVALLVCLIPATIGGLLSAIGVAGIDHMLQKNVVATSHDRAGSADARHSGFGRPSFQPIEATVHPLSIAPGVH